MTGLYYEEFAVGETIEHERRRTISESDNQRFCDMTMNQQPLHLDHEFAADTEFGQRLVNGLYTMSLAVGVSIPETTDGTIVANLSYDDVEHPTPVFHGDTIRAQSTVTDKRETSDGDRGVVTMHVEAFKTNDCPVSDANGTSSDSSEGADEPLVCEFDRTVLSLKREHAAEAE
ncbi:MaoC family dehydratase [Natrinema marinum]|uniref:MaoC family dehydratase n=1 Tax=Natrinema marinum TaxID=2961598 RepID=UPI0020C8C777|nr:MaoC family dehydratase [Natrinema marinum]